MATNNISVVLEGQPRRCYMVEADSVEVDCAGQLFKPTRLHNTTIVMKDRGNNSVARITGIDPTLISRVD